MKGNSSARSGQAVLVSLILLGAFVQVAMGQPNVQGKWSTLSYTMPINPIHAALLHTGKVLIVAGSGNCPPTQSGCPSGPPYGPSNNSGAALLDPVAGTITQLTVNWDMFCNGMVVLPDGRAFIVGGTLIYSPFSGEVKSSIFDPSTNTFTDQQNMAHGRWYPTVTTLGDGRVMAFSGFNENGEITNTAVEIYTVNSGWSPQYTANWTPPLYPRMHLLPSGEVFYSGETNTTRTFDPSNQSWATVANTYYGITRTYGSSVLLALTPANNYDPKVIIMGGGNPGTSTTETIDLGASKPAWNAGPNMSQHRIEMNATILPSGKVLAMGGSLNDEDATTASLNADLYDPASNTFSSAGKNAYARLYHSVSLLLPDGTVWLAGGNPSRGTYEQHMEIYQPAYLFNSNGTLATRPTISSAPGSVTYGAPFTVTTPDAANISSVVLMRNGAVTHAFDMDQRLVGLSFTAGAGSLTVTAPPNGDVAPPGYYMLFLLNSSGVPSVSSSIQVTSPPPTGINFVQVNSAPRTIQASNSSVAVTYSSTQTAGNLNIVAVGWGDTTSSISSVTDSKGNTYTRAVGPTSTTRLQHAIYYAKNIAGGSSNTVTVKFNQAAAYPDVRILEYSGLDTSSPLDVTAAATGNGTSASSGSATTTSANELIFGAGNSANNYTAAGSGFANRIINVYGSIAEDELVSSSGSYAATATNSSGYWVLQMATFKAK
jgi:Galactose oxidase-like, Early set domain/Glyoxal oxidase N-terminus